MPPMTPVPTCTAGRTAFATPPSADSPVCTGSHALLATSAKDQAGAAAAVAAGAPSAAPAAMPPAEKPRAAPPPLGNQEPNQSRNPAMAYQPPFTVVQSTQEAKISMNSQPTPRPNLTGSSARFTARPPRRGGGSSPARVRMSSY